MHSPRVYASSEGRGARFQLAEFSLVRYTHWSGEKMHKRHEGSAKVAVIAGIGCLGVLVVLGAAGAAFYLTSAAPAPAQPSDAAGAPALPNIPGMNNAPSAAAASSCGAARACCIALAEMPNAPAGHTRQSCDSIAIAERTPMADQVCPSMLAGYRTNAYVAVTQAGGTGQVPAACESHEAASPMCARALSCCEAAMRASHAPAAQAAQACSAVRVAGVSPMGESACAQSLEAFRSMAENAPECAAGPVAPSAVAGGK